MFLKNRFLSGQKRLDAEFFVSPIQINRMSAAVGLNVVKKSGEYR
jgi:hypothetical protein